MPTLRIPNVPKPLYDKLKRLKRKYKCSTWIEFLWLAAIQMEEKLREMEEELESP